jgi:hypothetical protein
MTPETQLLELYHQWRAMTQAEAAAIQEGNWARLLEIQNQKCALQERIDAAEPERLASFSAPKMDLKETLHDLILLEQQNAAALASRQQELQFEHQQLNQSSANLRQLQRAYSASPGAVWQSYS